MVCHWQRLDFWTALFFLRGSQFVQVLVEFCRIMFCLCLCFLFNHSPFHGCSTNLYIFLSIFRLCVVYLSFSSIGYAMPFILCATLCCCLPCIISVMGSREHLSHFRGAPPDSINSLPTYKFKMKKTRNGKGREIDCDASEGGIVAAGTEKERVISGEDAVSHFLIHFKFPWFITLWNFLDSNTEMDSHTHTHTHMTRKYGVTDTVVDTEKTRVYVFVFLSVDKNMISINYTNFFIFSLKSELRLF